MLIYMALDIIEKIILSNSVKSTDIASTVMNQPLIDTRESRRFHKYNELVKTTGSFCIRKCITSEIRPLDMMELRP